MPSIDLPLTPSGPIIPVCIHLSIQRILAMQQAGLSFGNPFLGNGLIDSGASCTVIDSHIVPILGLQPTGTTQIHTPSTGNTLHQCNCYDVSVWFSQIPAPAQPSIQVHPVHLTLPVIESDLSAQSIDVLIGRDILDQCHFTYDGKNKRFSLVYGP